MQDNIWKADTLQLTITEDFPPIIATNAWMSSKYSNIVLPLESCHLAGNWLFSTESAANEVYVFMSINPEYFLTAVRFFGSSILQLLPEWMNFWTEPSRIKTRFIKVISNCDPKQIPHSNGISLALHNFFGGRFHVRHNTKIVLARKSVFRKCCEVKEKRRLSAEFVLGHNCW